jgi:hypothetical protein
VALIPTYTPLRTDEANVTLDQGFYGGINVYLSKVFDFRHTPWLLDKLFNSRVVEFGARFSAPRMPRIWARSPSRFCKAKQAARRKNWRN